jgi:RimJ/RimL family protein N-acetyltransferase
MNDRDLMRVHIEALFTRDGRGDLVRVNEPNGARAPRFFLGRTVAGDVWRFRHDVPADARAEIEAAIRADQHRARGIDSPIDPAPYQAILSRSAPAEHTEIGPAYSFPDHLPRTNDAIRVTEPNAELVMHHLAPWLPDVRLSQPMFVVACDGHAVSVCASVRQTGEAYEAGVETAVAYRGRGFAAHAVAAWAHAVRELGRVPLYSTSWHNTASRAVARKLALIQFGSDLHIT